MVMIGHGIDIVEVARVRSLLEEPDGDFLAGCFTEAEREAEGAPHWRPHYYGGRLAAEEAVVKALGTGFSQGISWTDVEVGRHESGAPQVLLSGRATEIAAALGVARWHLSISHSDHYATASAIALGD